MENTFNSLFGKLAPGMCRLSMSGGIAVKTGAGYKTFNLKKGTLTNCDNFALNIGEEFFFCIPTTKVKKGDIILINGKPKCVLATDDKQISVINYEDNTVDVVLPERHVFMGNTYFYSKIVSMFGSNGADTFKGKNMGKLLKYKCMADMMGGKSDTAGGANTMMLMAMMGNGEMFDGLFNFDDEFSDSELTLDIDEDDKVSNADEDIKISVKDYEALKEELNKLKAEKKGE